MTDDPFFSVEDAVRAQRALRASLGLGDEAFPLQAFIGMISDEIQQMRESGRSDLEVIEVIAAATGRCIDIGDLRRFYAPEEQRRRA